MMGKSVHVLKKNYLVESLIWTNTNGKVEQVKYLAGMQHDGKRKRAVSSYPLEMNTAHRTLILIKTNPISLENQHKIFKIHSSSV